VEAVPSAGQVLEPPPLKSALPITPNVLSTKAEGMRALSESGCTDLDGAAKDTGGLGCSSGYKGRKGYGEGRGHLLHARDVERGVLSLHIRVDML